MGTGGRMNFADLLGPEPAWERCSCGALSMRVPCWSCAKAAVAEKAAERAAAGEEAERGIPARFRWAKIGAPELDSRVLVPAGTPSSVARRLAGSETLAVVLIGASGAGKTSLAVAAMREVPGAVFVPALALERARIMHKAGAGEAPLVRRALRAPLLVLDDLGQDKVTATSAVLDVMLERHDAERRTWITTWLDTASPKGSYPEMAARYGDGAVRRLTERGIGAVLRLGGAA